LPATNVVFYADFPFWLVTMEELPGKLQLVPQMTRWYKTPNKILFCLVPGGGYLNTVNTSGINNLI